MPRVALSILLGAVALTVASGSAFAADMSTTGADDLLANAPQVEETSGWYLRGDIGYVFNQAPDWSIPLASRHPTGGRCHAASWCRSARGGAFVDAALPAGPT